MVKKRLEKVIKEKGLTTKLVAKKIGILRFGLYLRMWGAVEFTLEEIKQIVLVLGLTESETAQIFFSKKFPKGN